MKEREGAPPPDFPEGGISRLQCCALHRPSIVPGMDLDVVGEEAEVVAGLGVRVDVGLVETAMASRWVGWRGRDGGEEEKRVAIGHPNIRY